MLLVTTTKSYAIDVTSPSSSIDIDEIYQVTPNSHETDPEWKDAKVCVYAPGRGVCMPEDEYLRKRQAQLENSQLKDALARQYSKSGQVSAEVIVGAAIMGFIMGGFVVGAASGAF